MGKKTFLILAMLKNIAKSRILIAVLAGASIYLAASQPLPAFAAVPPPPDGGIYTISLQDGSCRYSNPFTSGCSCPTGFATSLFSKFDNPGCLSGYYGFGVNCGIESYQCTSGSPTPPVGGIYTKNLSGGCRNNNPFTSGCSCPAGFTPAIFNEFDNSSHYYGGFYSDGGYGIESYQCISGATSPPIGGIYTENYNGSCRNNNPFTSGCSCPAGFTASIFNEFNNFTCANGFYSDGGAIASNCGIKTYQCTDPIPAPIITPVPPGPPLPPVSPLGGLVPCGRMDKGDDPSNIDMSKPCTLCAMFYLLKKIINFVMDLSVGIGVFILIMAGLFYALSAGNSRTIESAKSAATSAIIGLAIIFIAWLGIAVILQGLGYANITTWNQVKCTLPK